ncbi:MAG: YbfB/YjiJ family MFS transporter [Rhodospirillales bacterium]|nr:YbfB/YjiJ family MFS transporter [Rhodospirillales bacterium]
MLALAAGLGIGRFVYTPILPVMAGELGLSGSAAGLIASVNLFGYLCGAFAAASARLHGSRPSRSRRAWVLGALAVNVLTMAAMAAGDGMPLFLLLRFAGGVASAFILIFGSALVFDELARSGALSARPGLPAILFAGVGVGITLSAALIAALIEAGASWRVLWLAASALAAAASIAAIQLLPAGTPLAPQASSPGSAAHSGAKPFIRLVAAYGLFGIGYIITATFLVAIVRAAPSAAVAALEPLVWGIVGLAAVPSVAFWGWIARCCGAPAAFALACLAEAVGVAASVLGPSAYAIVLAALLLGGTFMGITAIGLMMARSLAGEDPQRAIAAVTVAFSIGQIIGPAFAGFVHDRTGSFLIPSLVAAAALTGAAIIVCLPRPILSNPNRAPFPPRSFAR